MFCFPFLHIFVSHRKVNTQEQKATVAEKENTPFPAIFTFAGKTHRYRKGRNETKQERKTRLLVSCTFFIPRVSFPFLSFPASFPFLRILLEFRKAKMVGKGKLVGKIVFLSCDLSVTFTLAGKHQSSIFAAE